MSAEFSLIEDYFSAQARRRPTPALLGIGDDGAVLEIPPRQQLVVTMDTLVAERHFPATTDPVDIGWKSLAVNVSDLVAMAATPFYFLLSLTLPAADDAFLRGFSRGLFEAADAFGIALVGGDTCKGPLSISIQASGLVSRQQFVTRSGARPGDHILLSGCVGAAALGLESIRQGLTLSAAQQASCAHALNRPQPRLDLIEPLRRYASAAIDVSDGLVADLGHILEQSGVGAELVQSRIPACDGVIESNRLDLALGGGDDYEIVFTVAEAHMPALLQDAADVGLALFDIGLITTSGYFMRQGSARMDLSTTRGFDHFGA